MPAHSFEFGKTTSIIEIAICEPYNVEVVANTEKFLPFKFQENSVSSQNIEVLKYHCMWLLAILLFCFTQQRSKNMSEEIKLHIDLQVCKGKGQGLLVSN